MTAGPLPWSMASLAIHMVRNMVQLPPLPASLVTSCLERLPSPAKMTRTGLKMYQHVRIDLRKIAISLTFGQPVPTDFC